MKSIWIIGGGKFGLLALKRLMSVYHDTRFVVVDPVQSHKEMMAYPGCDVFRTDGVAFLGESLLSKKEWPDWIVPAVPVHLAAEWCLEQFAEDEGGKVRLPQEIDTLLPNPMWGRDGNLYVSHADFRCPDNCNEPDDLCTVTRKPRKTDMFKLLKMVTLKEYEPVVIQSHQLAPGVGGYRPDHLLAFCDTTLHKKGNMLLCTACRCHGVITGVYRIDKGGA